MLHHLPLCRAALHLPFNMLSYYILCCPVLHYCILRYVMQHYIKPHYITLGCLIPHLISLPLLYPVLVCITPLYTILIHASLCYNMFHILIISWVPLPCLALPHVTLNYTTFCSPDCCKHLLVNHFLSLVLSHPALHNIIPYKSQNDFVSYCLNASISCSPWSQVSWCLWWSAGKQNK